MLTKYTGVNKGLHVLLSRTQAGPGRTVKQEQEEISRNHVQTFIYLSVDCTRLSKSQCIASTNWPIGLPGLGSTHILATPFLFLDLGHVRVRAPACTL